MRIGLAAFSFPWRCGFLEYGTTGLCPNPYSVNHLLDLTARYGLRTLEFPFQMLPDLEPATLRAFRARADELGIALVLASGIVDVASLEQRIPAAATLGARVLRVTLSGILEGARAGVPGGWPAYLDEMIARLRHLRPLAERHGVRLAPENHQDASSEELIQICEAVGGPCIGVTLDAVNPLAVGEEPLAFARALGSRIADVHLKDYLIYPTPSGYRLVRCALGDGVLDTPALLALLEEVAPDANCNIELAALRARHIRLLEDDWWQGFGPRDARDLIPALRLAARHARPSSEEWRTPFERNEPSEALAAYEDDQMERSVAYLRSIGA
jgi:sugar phosphate isomerase/epimerase